MPHQPNGFVTRMGKRLSAAIHQVKKLVPVEQIHSGLLDRLPAAKGKCPIVLWPLNKGLPKEIVGHALERTPFTDCLLLDPLQQVIINCQRRSGHASKCTKGYIKMSKASLANVKRVGSRVFICVHLRHPADRHLCAANQRATSAGSVESSFAARLPIVSL